MTTSRQAIAQSLAVINSLTVAPEPLPTHRILRLVVPSIELIDFLERLFENKRRKGETIPAVYSDWLALVKCIRTDLPNELDQMTMDDWQECSETVGKYVTGSDALQPALIDVPAKVEYR